MGETFASPFTGVSVDDPGAFREVAGDIGEVFARTLEEVQSKLYQRARNVVYYDHPEIWAKEVLGFHAWSKQVDIGQSVANNPFTAVKSCHGAGKSSWAAVLVCWFVATRHMAGEKVYVITTAPTYQQVHSVLWEEIRTFHEKGKLPGYITNGDEWKMQVGARILEFAIGRKPADNDKNGFQGKHMDNLMIVLDEANGIPVAIYDGAVVQVTGDMNRQKVLAIGNPDDPNSVFGQNDARDQAAIKEGRVPRWNTIQIKAWDTPNFTDEKLSLPPIVLSSVLQPEWVEARREDWGTGDMRWTSKIEAEFPTESSDGLIPPYLIDQVKANAADPEYERTERRLGVDIARYGDDRTVVYIFESGKARVLDFWAKKSTVESANRIHKLAIENSVTEVRIDEGAMGAGVIDPLFIYSAHHYTVIPMNASRRSPDPLRWVNSRAYWYDNMREQMVKNMFQLEPHRDTELELKAITYKFTKHGAMQVEEKAEIKKRLDGHSPDFSDALAYCLADLTPFINNPADENDFEPRNGDTRIMDIMQAEYELAGNGWITSPV